MLIISINSRWTKLFDSHFMRKLPFSTASHLVFEEPDSLPTLFAGEIHLWCARLIPQPESLRFFRSLLDDEEEKRVNSFQFAKDQNRFILSHGYLRSLLGYYVNQNPKKLQFALDEHGKPCLKTHSIEFNLSHSEDLALFSFSLDGKIGVDIEHVRGIPEAADIIKRLFSSREKWIHFLTPSVCRQEVFFEFWTRGEAVVKAAGYGFGERVGTISKRAVFYAGNTWRIESFNPAPGYLGAIAFEKSPGSIQCKHLPEAWLIPGRNQQPGV
jgi:4'-phosphopantetheinyl transferase